MQGIKVYAGKPWQTANQAFVPVFWATGKINNGKIIVMFPVETPDQQAAAEIIAFRYFLHGKYIHAGRQTGKNLQLQVSKGAIKKIHRGDSDKRGLYEFGYELLTRYAGATIIVSKDTDWLPDEENLPHPPVYLDSNTYRENDLLLIDQLGDIRITRHALEKYHKLCGTTDLATAWCNMTRRLNANLAKVPVPVRVLAHKYRKYGESPEVWNSVGSHLHYVLAPKGGFKALVTVFDRDPEEHAEVFRPGFANAGFVQ